MNRKNLQKEQLDSIGRKLLDAARIRNEEIEQIIAAPRVFDAVKARIKAGEREPKSKNLFGSWENLSALNRQKYFAMASVLAFFVIVAAGLILLNKFPKQIEQVHIPVLQPQIKSFENQPKPKISENISEIPGTKNSVIRPEITVKRADFKSETLKMQKPELKIKSAKRQQYSENESKREFYALTYTGNSIETGEDLRIIRTELSRSSLFALGVNLPIENGAEKIKTDLLVGADGVARAIRIVD